MPGETPLPTHVNKRYKQAAFTATQDSSVSANIEDTRMIQIQFVSPAAASSSSISTTPTLKNNGNNEETTPEQTTTTLEPLLVPVNTTQAHLQLLITTLLSNSQSAAAAADSNALVDVPYAFTTTTDDDQVIEITKSLVADIGQNLSTESVLTIHYHPQSIFRVHAMTRCSSTLSGHTEAILAVSFSPDGRSLATASGDTTVRIWDLATETPRVTCKGHKHWVQTLAWEPMCQVLASGGMDKEIRIWDPKTGTAYGPPLTGHTQSITALAWQPLHSTPASAAAADDLPRLASASKDGTVRVWNVKARSVLYTLAQHTAPVMCVRWGGEGALFTAGRDREIKVWNETDGRLIRTLTGHAHWINHLALSTDHLLRTGPFDPNTKKKSGTFLHFASRSAARAAAVARYKAWTAANTNNGGERVISASDDLTVFLWKPHASVKPVARLTGHQQVVNHVAFSPDGRWIASASFDKSVKLWDAASGKFITTLRGHVGAVYQVAFSPDSRLLLSASKDSTCKVWDLSKRALSMDLPGHADEVFAVDWCPMGWGGASGGKDRTVKIWRH